MYSFDSTSRIGFDVPGGRIRPSNRYADLGMELDASAKDVQPMEEHDESTKEDVQAKAFAERTRWTVSALLVIMQETRNRRAPQNPEAELAERQRRAARMQQGR